MRAGGSARVPRGGACPRSVASRRPRRRRRTRRSDGRGISRPRPCGISRKDGTGTASPRRARPWPCASACWVPSHLEVAEALDLLGRLLERSGDYPEAQKVLERALGIKEAALGTNSADVADTVEALAQVLQQGGNLGAARPLYERALRIREDVLGPDAVEVSGALNGLGWVQLDLGDLGAARVSLERALRIRERTLGPNHYRTSQTLAHLGRLYRDLGEYDQARATFERALRIQERVLGPEHPELGYVLTQYGALYERLDDYAKARPLIERSLAIREKALGPNHPAVAWILTNLANVLRISGDNAAALPLIERALRIQEQALGPNHPALAETLRNRARIAQGLRNYVLARSDLERALKIAEPVLGPTHPRIGLLLNNLGFVLWETRDVARAQATLERAIQILRGGGLPEIHWRTANFLGRIHERNGKRVEAAAAYYEATTVIRGLAGNLAGQQSRAQYLESANRLAVFDSLARVLLRLHERDATKGYELEALAAIEAKKALLVATTMAAARPTLQDPEARRVARDVGEKKSQTTRLERALQAEQGKDPGEQRPERIQELTRELAQTKGEYLTQVQAFLARYPRYRAQFVEQQTVDPEGDREVRGAAAGRHAGRPVLRRARRPLPLRRCRGREVPGPHPGGLAEGPLRPGPRVPHPARAGGGAAAAVGGRRVGGLPPRRGAAQGGDREACRTPPRPHRSRSSLPTRI